MKAFPTTVDNGHSANQDGMDLRDYFASDALKGMLANPACNLTPEETVNASYHIAELMMAARK